MTSDTTGYLNLRLMVVVYDAVRRELARRTAVLAGWELFKTQLHIHHTALEAL